MSTTTLDLKPMLRWEIERLFARAFPGLDASWPNRFWSWVVEAYSAPSRHYHDLRHIEEMVEFILLRASKLLGPAPDPRDPGPRPPLFNQEQIDKMLWAAILHDYVYDTQATKGSNEERSAKFARTQLEAFHDEVYVRHPLAQPLLHVDRYAAEVHDLILVTVDHDAKTDMEKLLCDADLARFALDWPGFVLNNQVNIRQEYGWVSDEDWQAGRAAVLEHYLLRDPMFYFATDLQPLAEANLVRALRQVKKGQSLSA